MLGDGEEGGAPLATIDGEDWQEFSDYRPFSTHGVYPRTTDINTPPPPLSGGVSDSHTNDNINTRRPLDNEAAHLTSPPQTISNGTVPEDVNLALQCFRSENHESIEILSQDMLLRDSQ